MWFYPLFLTIMAIISYNRSILTKAGPVKIKELLEEEPYNESCDKCGTFKPPRVHHCTICRKCVFRMDHHCDWIYNCIGAKNQKFFILFLGYTFLYCLYVFLLTIVAFGIWCYRIPEGEFWEYFFKPRFSKCGTTMLFLLSLGFGLFSLEYIYSQLNGIHQN